MSYFTETMGNLLHQTAFFNLPLGLFDWACYYTFGCWGQYVPYHFKDLAGIAQEAVGICEFHSGHCITF